MLPPLSPPSPHSPRPPLRAAWPLRERGIAGRYRARPRPGAVSGPRRAAILPRRALPTFVTPPAACRETQCSARPQQHRTRSRGLQLPACTAPTVLTPKLPRPVPWPALGAESPRGPRLQRLAPVIRSVCAAPGTIYRGHGPWEKLRNHQRILQLSPKSDNNKTPRERLAGKKSKTSC